LLVAASVEKKTLALDFSDDRIEKFREQGKKIGNSNLISYVNIFSVLHNQLRYASNPRVLLEIASMKLCAPSLDNSFDSLTARIEILERELKEKIAQVQNTSVTSVAPITPITPVTSVAPVAPVAPVQAAPSTAAVKAAQKITTQDALASRDWSAFTRSVKLPARSYLDQCAPGALSGNVLPIICKDISTRDFLAKKQSELQEAISKHYQKDLIISFRLQEDRLEDDSTLIREVQEKINMPIQVE
jgi:DNA polymerase III gamma/tau subunit